MPVIIFKAIEKCNSNCCYCEVITKKQEQIMNFDLLSIVFEKINDFLLEYTNEHIDFTWHGGEIGLLGAIYFNEVIRLLNTICPNTKNRIVHLVQSNMTLLNQDILNAFKELNINSIGSSYDFIPNIRGFGKNRDHIAYNKAFFKGVNLVEENGFSWGVIYVVHKKSLLCPSEVFHTLVNLNLKSGFSLNKVYFNYDEEENNLAITELEYANFMGEVFEIWWKNKDRYPKVDPFSQFLYSIEKKRNCMVCNFAGHCAYNWLYIGPTGETSQCGRSTRSHELSYGNIRDYSLWELLHFPTKNKIAERQNIFIGNDCKDCRFWYLCKGGCPVDSLTYKGSISKKSPDCIWVKHFFEHYFEPITGIKITKKMFTNE